jgi:flagellar protein FlbB
MRQGRAKEVVMARYSGVNVTMRVLGLLVLLLAVVLGGLMVLDFLGLYSIRPVVAPFLKIVGVKPPSPAQDPDDPLLLDKERFEMRQMAVEAMAKELSVLENSLASKEQEIGQKVEMLSQKEKELEDQKNALIKVTDSAVIRNENIRRNSEKLVGMRPENAVAILEQMDDQDVIDIILATDKIAAEKGEASITAYWLSKMTVQKAADIQRKMALRTES